MRTILGVSAKNAAQHTTRRRHAMKAETQAAIETLVNKRNASAWLNSPEQWTLCVDLLASVDVRGTLKNVEYLEASFDGLLCAAQ
jgi:hypothetical protein